MLSRALPLLFLATHVLVAQEPSFDALREQGRWKQLRPRIEGWYRLKPQDPYALMWMSRLKLAFGEPDAALDLARKAVALKETDAELQTQLGVAADRVRASASFLKQLPRAKEMQKALEAAVAASPTHEEANNLLLRYYLAAPSVAGGSLSKAKDLAQRFSQVKPAQALVFQALIAVYGKDFEGARASLQRAIAMDSHLLMAYRELVVLCLGRKPQAQDEATATCRKALETNPTAVEIYANLAGLLAEQGKWGELEAILAQAKQQCPDNLLPHFYAAFYLLQNNQLDKVEPYLRTYLSQDPEGFAPDHPEAHVQLARLFEKQGRRPEAIKAYEQALSLRPTFDFARKGLERLRKG